MRLERVGNPAAFVREIVSEKTVCFSYTGICKKTLYWR